MSDIERFMSKVVIAESGCWLWNSTRDQDGYGKFYFKGKTLRAHRYIWKVLIGDLESQDDLHHKDRCPKFCVNPAHLTLLPHGEHSALHYDGNFLAERRKIAANPRRLLTRIGFAPFDEDILI